MLIVGNLVVFDTKGYHGQLVDIAEHCFDCATVYHVAHMVDFRTYIYGPCMSC